MKASTFGWAAAILLLATGAGFGIAQAGGAVWNVEAMDSFFGYQPEGRPVTFFHLSFKEDQGLSQEAKSTPEDTQLESPIETGSFPSGIHADSSIIETSGSTYRAGVDTGP